MNISAKLKENELKEFSQFDILDHIKVNSNSFDKIKKLINKKDIKNLFLKLDTNVITIILDNSIPYGYAKAIYNTGREEIIKVLEKI